MDMRMEDPGLEAAVEEHLQRLKDPQHRQQISTLESLTAIVGCIHQHLSCRSVAKLTARPLLLLLRLLRNLTAMEPQLVGTGLTDIGFSTCLPLAVQLLTQQQSQHTAGDGQVAVADVTVAVAQLMANWAGSCPQGAAAIWSSCFPATFQLLFSFPLGRVVAPSTMALYQCCRTNVSYSLQLCSSRGHRILTALLNQARESSNSSSSDQAAQQQRRHVVDSPEAAVNEWLPLLVSCVAVRQGLLRTLLRCLEPPPGLVPEPEGPGCDATQGTSDGWVWCEHQAVVLHLVAHELEVMKDGSPVGMQAAPGAAAAAAAGEVSPAAAAAPALAAAGGGALGAAAATAVVETSRSTTGAAASKTTTAPSSGHDGARVDAVEDLMVVGPGSGAVPKPSTQEQQQQEQQQAAGHVRQSQGGIRAVPPWQSALSAIVDVVKAAATTIATAAAAMTAAAAAGVTGVVTTAAASSSSPYLAERSKDQSVGMASAAAGTAAAAAAGTAGAGADAAAGLRVGGGPSPTPALQSQGQFASHVLEAALEALKKLLSREDQGMLLFGADPWLFLVSERQLLQLLLAMLLALEPVQARRQKTKEQQQQLLQGSAEQGQQQRQQVSLDQQEQQRSIEQGQQQQQVSMEHGQGQQQEEVRIWPGLHPAAAAAAAGSGAAGEAGSSTANTETPSQPHQATLPVDSEVASLVAGLPWTSPYLGYRGDVLSVLSNVIYGRPEVAGRVCSLGGVELILSQCQLDEDSPLAREYALWAVRNLCAGSEEAQRRIRELEVVSSVETPELQKMGMKLELDKQSGKMKIVKTHEQL